MEKVSLEKAIIYGRIIRHAELFYQIKETALRQGFTFETDGTEENWKNDQSKLKTFT